MPKFSVKRKREMKKIEVEVEQKEAWCWTFVSEAHDTQVWLQEV